MNKKGQGEGSPVGTVAILALVVIVVVILILGFVFGWGNLAQKIGIYTPSTNIDDLVNSCNFAITQPGAFCEFKLVNLDNTKQYVNCQDTRIVAKLQTGAAPSCTGYADITAFCTGKDAKTLVNGKTCLILAPTLYPA